MDAPSDDYHLQSGSPCIDAGSNSAEGIPAKDLDNKPRIIDGDGDGTSIVDIGAYEFGSLNNPPILNPLCHC